MFIANAPAARARTRLHGVLALALAAALTSCDSPSRPSSDLTLSLDVTPTLILQNSSGIITAALRNEGGSTRSITLNSGCASLIRISTYPGNEPVPTLPCAAVTVPLTLEPGQLYTQTISVTSSGPGPSPMVMLPPGEYQVRASSSESDVPTLRSGAVRLTVR